MSEIRRLAERSMAARRHTGEFKMEAVSLFAADDYFAAEYLHRAIVTENWPSSARRPSERHNRTFLDEAASTRAA
jgi:hypothetical protein